MAALIDIKPVWGQMETVFMHQPSGFIDAAHPDYVCHLKKSLYGLKQAPRARFQRFAQYAIRTGFLSGSITTALMIIGIHKLFFRYIRKRLIVNATIRATMETKTNDTPSSIFSVKTRNDHLVGSVSQEGIRRGWLQL
ncbi:hypothetical protein OSB04_016293 [Centaurea solstitialis]|uniref:Reverse transcriptase Ty1/copia-type domain-containing protein n=1 Tax=Centaurea solstitialis TaxID=347529 RepID=A0AA38TKP0_9ASTR|nr:hypothetical protein OSB04_016293 [Centaurea solstitialis]